MWKFEIESKEDDIIYFVTREAKEPKVFKSELNLSAIRGLLHDFADSVLEKLSPMRDIMHTLNSSLD